MRSPGEIRAEIVTTRAILRGAHRRMNQLKVELDDARIEEKRGEISPIPLNHSSSRDLTLAVLGDDLWHIQTAIQECRGAGIHPTTAKRHIAELLKSGQLISEGTGTNMWIATPHSPAMQERLAWIEENTPTTPTTYDGEQ